MTNSEKERLIQDLFNFFKSKNFENDVSIFADKARYDWINETIEKTNIPVKPEKHVLTMLVYGDLLMYLRSNNKDEIYSIYEKYNVEEFRVEIEAYGLREKEGK